jgi:hypothetical protein
MESAMIRALLAAAVLCTFISNTRAECTRLAFSVNDYGKVGPAKDAEALLDKYVARWAAERGIKNYKTGKKTTSCELFLDFIVFDEYTCKAEASVCWEGGPAITGASVGAGAAALVKSATGQAGVTMQKTPAAAGPRLKPAPAAN